VANPAKPLEDRLLMRDGVAVHDHTPQLVPSSMATKQIAFPPGENDRQCKT
jgi:hypothetical protein